MRRLAALAVLLATLPACAPSFRPIAEPGGDARFKARIATRYPPGSLGSRLRTELAAQGFVLLADPTGRRYSAIDRPDNLPCYSETRIDWNEDRRGRILVIQAARHACS
ncbi:hypothetical protein [uncultured Enterovirga sp.]|uniref:hypothetical protein n=1 Tax=uncultured Enterovirga sp. TaxID=2026352 RepID=UPI0035CBC96F